MQAGHDKWPSGLQLFWMGVPGARGPTLACKGGWRRLLFLGGGWNSQGLETKELEAGDTLEAAQGLQDTRVATREESGVLGFPSRRGLTPRANSWCPLLEKNQ